MCDLQACGELIDRIFLDLVCRLPDSTERGYGVEACCLYLPESTLRGTVRERETYDDRHSCPGCTSGCSCTAGYYADALETGGNVCTACDGATGYNPLSGQDGCLNVTQCGVGEEEAVAPSISSDRLCQKCPAGAIDHDSSGATPCVPCALGETYMPVGAQTECLPTTQCRAGQEEFIEATYVSDRVCISCDEGVTFKPEAGQSTQCRGITYCRFPSLEYVAVSPTRTSDTVCAPITRCNPDTQWRSADATLLSDAQCSPLTECDTLETEYIITAKTVTSDRVCAPLLECTAEEYEAQAPTPTTNRVCQPHTICGVYQFDIVKSTPTSDRECIDVVEAFAFAPLPIFTANYSAPLAWAVPAPNATATNSTADATGTGEGSGGDTGRRRRGTDGDDLLLARQAALNATWGMVHSAAEQQAVQALEDLGLSASADVALLTVALIHSADRNPMSSWELDTYGLENAAIVVHILLTSPEAWHVYMAGLISGIPRASLAYADWPLVLSPCLPEAYLFDAVRVAQNGSTTVPCISRQQCVLSETFVSWTGNRTADRMCQTVQACEHGERRPPSLTTDRVCQSPTQSVASTGTVGAIAGLVVVMLVLVLVIVVYRRRRAAAQHRTAAKSGPPLDQMQTKFVNPSFVGRVGGRGGLENTLYAENDVRNVLYSDFDGWEDDDGGLYCDLDDLEGIDELRDARKAAEDGKGGGLQRQRSSRRRRSRRGVIKNPLYDEGGEEDVVEGLYDEVVGMEPGSGTAGYFDVHPDTYMEVADLREDVDSYLAVESDDEDDGGYLDVNADEEGGAGKYMGMKPSRLVANGRYLDVKPRLEEHGGYMDVNPHEAGQEDDGGGYLDVNADEEEDGGYLDVKPEPEPETEGGVTAMLHGTYATLQDHGGEIAAAPVAKSGGSLYARLSRKKKNKKEKKSGKTARKVAPAAQQAAEGADFADGDADLHLHAGAPVEESWPAEADNGYMDVAEEVDQDFVGFSPHMVGEDSDGESYFDLDAQEE
jgi:hypothetical protein